MEELQVQHRRHRMQQKQQQHAGEGIKARLDKGPSSSQVLVVTTLFPVGGVLLTLSGLMLTGTVIGLALATPLFVVFSPVLVPAAMVIGLALAGFLAAGTLGLAALSALSWIVNYLQGKAPKHGELARRRAQEAARHAGKRAKEVGQVIQDSAREGGGRT